MDLATAPKSVTKKEISDITRNRRLIDNIRDNKENYLMLAPFMILFLIFTVLPVLASIGLSFTYFNMLEPPKFRGWLNYIRLFFDDDVFLIAVKNTLIFAFVTGPLSYFMCLMFAWLVNELPPKPRAFMTLLLYAPSISGNLFVIWKFIFSGDAYGMVNGLLMKYGILDEAVQWLQDPKYMMKIIIVVQLWLSLGASFLSFIAGLQSVDPELYEAGSIDGIRNRWQELWFITLPSMGPQLMFGAVMQISASFAVSDVCEQLAGFPSTDYAAHTVATHIKDFGTVKYEMGYASAIATILFITMIVTNNIIRHFLGKISDE